MFLVVYPIINIALRKNRNVGEREDMGVTVVGAGESTLPVPVAPLRLPKTRVASTWSIATSTVSVSVTFQVPSFLLPNFHSNSLPFYLTSSVPICVSEIFAIISRAINYN